MKSQFARNEVYRCEYNVQCIHDCMIAKNLLSALRFDAIANAYTSKPHSKMIQASSQYSCMISLPVHHPTLQHLEQVCTPRVSCCQAMPHCWSETWFQHLQMKTATQ